MGAEIAAEPLIPRLQILQENSEHITWCTLYFSHKGKHILYMDAFM
jgi:hypothetical protein